MLNNVNKEMKACKTHTPTHKEFPYYPKIGDYIGTALVKVKGDLILVGICKTEHGLRIDTPFRWHASVIYVDSLKYERVLVSCRK